VNKNLYIAENEVPPFLWDTLYLVSGQKVTIKLPVAEVSGAVVTVVTAGAVAAVDVAVVAVVAGATVTVVSTGVLAVVCDSVVTVVTTAVNSLTHVHMLKNNNQLMFIAIFIQHLAYVYRLLTRMAGNRHRYSGTQRSS